MTPEERLRHIREVAERVAERLVDQWPQEGAHINELEDFAERMGQTVQREVSERVLQDEAARKEGNQCRCPGCGAMATFQRLHWLTLALGRPIPNRPSPERSLNRLVSPKRSARRSSSTPRSLVSAISAQMARTHAPE